MRIVQIAVLLQIVFVMIFPGKAVATETFGNTKPKINFNIQQNITLENGVTYNTSFSLIENKTGKSLSEEILSLSEKQRLTTLSRWKKKQTRLWSNLPHHSFTINASAYTAAADECGKSDGITASGLKVREKWTLACPPNFPFGSRIKIEGMRTYVCEDRGGAIKGNHFDIYMKTKRQAFAFGRKNLSAEIVFD